MNFKDLNRNELEEFNEFINKIEKATQHIH